MQKPEKKRLYTKGSVDHGRKNQGTPNTRCSGKGAPVKFTFDEGEPIAAALKAAGVMVHRYTKKEHKPRGIFCAIGRCTDCVMVVDGVPNVRTCITPLKAGMDVRTQYGVSEKPFAEQ